MYRVIVGNIGNVVTTASYNEALATYNEYVEQSETGYGRAAFEDVYLLKDSEPLKTHYGRNTNE